MQVAPEKRYVQGDGEAKHIDNSWVFADTRAITVAAAACGGAGSSGGDEEREIIRRVPRGDVLPPASMFSPSAPWRFWWESALNMLILIQVIIVPFELAFIEEPLMHTHVVWLLFEVLVVVVFFADMVLNFRTGFLKYGKVIYDPRQAALFYARGRFGLDFFAWLPCLLGLVFATEEEEVGIDDGRSTALARLARSFRFFRVVRLLRIMQILRVVRLRAVANDLQLKLHECPAVMNATRGMFMVLTIAMCIHLTACLWASIALESHIESFDQVDLAASLLARYVFGLWWASCSLTVGGQPAPNSTGEMVLAFFVNLFSAFLVGAIFTWCFHFFTPASEPKSSLVQSMQAASRFADLHDLPKELREEMRTVIHQSQHQKQIHRDFEQLVGESLSDSLRKRIYGNVYSDVLRRFPPFSKGVSVLYPGCMEVSQEFLWQLAYGSKLVTFQAEERVVTVGEPARTMSFVIDGCLLIHGQMLPHPQILQKHGWFGEKVVIFDSVRRNRGGNTFFVNATPTRTANIVALQFSTLLEIDKDVLMDAVHDHHLHTSWLEPLAEHLKMKRRTLGCSCCGDVFHTILDCPDPAAKPNGEPERFLKLPSPTATEAAMTENPRPKWLATRGKGNDKVPPEMWGMRLEQWAAFIMACCFTKTWAELERDTMMKDAGHVNLYQINASMVQPWTRNTGSSVALLMNSEKPLKADVMISHAWAESIIETLVAVLGKATVTGMKMDTVVWFCTFSQYQAGNMEGDCGPTISQQLARDPFKRVIESMPPHGMLVIHTSTAELYSRLWCAFEINEALENSLQAIPAYSMGALQRLFGAVTGTALVASSGLPSSGADGHSVLSPRAARLNCLKQAVVVDTSKATCGIETDTDMITRKILDAGGFEVLNEKIVAFRMDSVEEFDKMFTSFTDWAAGGDNRDAVFEGLMELVSKAGIFVGLRCFLPYALQAQDEQLLKDIEGLARDILELWQGAFKGFDQLPPGIKAADMPSAWENVRDCLLDETKAPVAAKLLRMSAGGAGARDVSGKSSL